jgi:hypothetical protein
MASQQHTAIIEPAILSLFGFHLLPVVDGPPSFLMTAADLAFLEVQGR